MGPRLGACTDGDASDGGDTRTRVWGRNEGQCSVLMKVPWDIQEKCISEHTGMTGPSLRREGRLADIDTGCPHRW